MVGITPPSLPQQVSDAVNNPIQSLVGKNLPLNKTSEIGTALAAKDSSSLVGNSAGLKLDAYMNWYAMDGSDFRFTYGYALVITNKDQYVNHIFFPINPSDISFSVPVATNVSATLKGISENNNGAPFRAISVNGVSGVWHPSQFDASQKSTANSTLDYLFKNTIQAVNAVATQANKVAAAFSGSPQKFSGPLNYDKGLLTTNAQPDQASLTSSTMLTNSGHWFFHNLMRFLDYYTAIKSGRDGKDYRLTFHMYKDRMYYDVVLSNYDWKKRPGTVEYDYSIRMVAYRRRANPAGGVLIGRQQSQVTAADTLSTLASIVNTLRQTRLLLAKVTDVIRGVSADANDSFFTPMREVILLASDTVGVAATLADMPAGIIQSAKASFNSALNDVTGSAAQLRASIDNTLRTFGLKGPSNVPGTSALTAQVLVQASDGNSDLAVRNPTASPSEKIFQDPTKFSQVFDQVTPDQLTLPAATQTAINDEVNRVRAFQPPDLTSRRDSIRQFSDKYAESAGGGSATYNAVRGLPPPKQTFRQLNTEDIYILSLMNNTLMATDQLIYLLQTLNAVPNNDYYSFYADYALSNGLDFTSAQSKFLVPFPYGGSLEQLAVQYLGDQSRWSEIASLNGLKEPYVDEDGFTKQLIASASENSVVVSDRFNLFVNQIVFVQSNSVIKVQKKIAKIDRVTDTYYLITFVNDGISLLPYDISDDASIQAFLPDTVNSTKLIAIPSQAPVNVPGKIKLTPEFSDLSNISEIADVDFLLTSDGNLAISGTGDVMLASGMTNLIQAAVLRLQTPQGSMLNDPNYGNPLQPGISASNLNVKQYLIDLSAQFQKDPRFVGLLAGQVSLLGPTASLQILLGVSGTDLNLPVQAALPV